MKQGSELKKYMIEKGISLKNCADQMTLETKELEDILSKDLLDDLFSIIELNLKIVYLGDKLIESRNSNKHLLKIIEDQKLLIEDNLLTIENRDIIIENLRVKLDEYMTYNIELENKLKTKK